MATITFPVSTYSLHLGRQIEASGAKFYGYISCDAADGNQFLLYFVRPDSITPANFYNPAIKRGGAFLPADKFPWYVDLLRNEKPVNAYLNTDKPEWNNLYTGNEPIGEGE